MGTSIQILTSHSQQILSPLGDFCPADRREGRCCQFPELRSIAGEYGMTCCSAGICNIQAHFSRAFQNPPSVEEVRQIFGRLQELQGNFVRRSCLMKRQEL